MFFFAVTVGCVSHKIGWKSVESILCHITLTSNHAHISFIIYFHIDLILTKIDTELAVKLQDSAVPFI